jgi:hypothetical protein
LTEVPSDDIDRPVPDLQSGREDSFAIAVQPSVDEQPGLRGQC